MKRSFDRKRGDNKTTIIRLEIYELCVGKQK